MQATADLYAQIEALYLGGLGYQGVANRLGVGRGRVEKYIRKRGLSATTRKAPLATSEQIAEVLRLGRMGYGGRFCASKTGLSVYTCIWHLRRNGIGRAKPKNGQAIGHWGAADIEQFGKMEREHGRWWGRANLKQRRTPMDWYYANVEKARRLSRESAKRRYDRLKDTPEYKAKQAARNAVGRLIRFTKGEFRKSFSTQRYLGCTYAECAAHIQKQFTRGMSWANYGTVWEIDHIIPLAAWDLTDPTQFTKACNYLNLRPLRKEHNRPGLYPKVPPNAQISLGLAC